MQRPRDVLFTKDVRREEGRERDDEARRRNGTHTSYQVAMRAAPARAPRDMTLPPVTVCVPVTVCMCMCVSTDKGSGSENIDLQLDSA